MRKLSIVAGVASLAILAGMQLNSWAHCGSCGSGEAKKRVDCTACEVKDTAKAAAAAEATVNTAGLKAILQAKVTVTLLDARSGKFDDGRRIPGAVALNAESSDEEVAKVLPDKNRLVITYCASLKCGASHALAEHLRKAGYANVIEYPEGIAGWADAGNTVDSPKNTQKGG